MMLAYINAERDDESENNFGPYLSTRGCRFITLEFIGTFCYTLISAGSVLSTGVLTYQFGIEEQTPGRILAIAFAQGLVCAALLYATTSYLDNKLKRKSDILKAAHVDGIDTHKRELNFRAYPVGHFNPAITFAMTLAKVRHKAENQISPATAIMYWLAQVTGAIAAVTTLYGLFSGMEVSENPLGATVPGDGVTPMNALLMEAILSFILTFVMLQLLIRGEDVRDIQDKHVHDDSHVSEMKRIRESRGYVKDIAPLVIGFVHVALSVLGIPISGASLNPARSFACALLSNIWTEHWLYWVGPFLGSGLAAMMFAFVMLRMTADSRHMRSKARAANRQNLD